MEASSSAAFISYGHGDVDVARRLERGLRRFARPVFGRARVRAVRDQSSLRPSEDLWASIQHQLGHCTHLVLLASPAAAKSTWVPREVAHFAERQPLSSIILVLVDGRLRWDDARGGFDPDGSDALPAEVMARYQAQPLYVDLRWARGVADPTGDPRWPAALLDIASVALGVDKEAASSADALARRGALRLAWSAVAVLGVLFATASVLGLFAYRSSRIAEDRLRAGQAHVGELLTIVDGELVQLRGARDARQALLDGSRALLGRLGEASSTESRRTGQILTALQGTMVGTESAHVGDGARTLAEHGRARTAAAALEASADAGARTTAASVLTDVGSAAFVLGELDAAVADLRRAVALREALHRDQPDAARTFDLATALDRLGRVLYRAGDLDEATRLHERALAAVAALPADAVDSRARSLALAESEMLLYDVESARAGLPAERLQAAGEHLSSIADGWRLDVLRRRLDLDIRVAALLESYTECRGTLTLAFELFASERESDDALRLTDALAICGGYAAPLVETVAAARDRFAKSLLRIPRLEAALLMAEGQARALAQSPDARDLLTRAAAALAPLVASAPSDAYLRASLTRTYQFLMSIPGDDPGVVSLLQVCIAAAGDDRRHRADCRTSAVSKLVILDATALLGKQPPSHGALAVALEAVDEAVAIDAGTDSSRARLFNALRAAESAARALGEPERRAELCRRAADVASLVARDTPESPALPFMRAVIADCTSREAERHAAAVKTAAR
jgi:hypothetical protein